MAISKSQSIGKVYLVGAGPGNPGLVTKRALEVLHSCDVVVFDNLIPEELVAVLPTRVERHYVGKQAGDHALPQHEINALLASCARDGKSVVRLKGGDPFIFGRGGEEAAYLREHAVRFEIVPGVTSGIAASAYAGIPLTDRELSSQVLFVTGHKSAAKNESSVDWKWVAGMRQGTIVVYMGVSEAPGIVRYLIDGGMSPKTPCAAIERGTMATQRVTTSTLEELPKAIVGAGVKPPALFVIGNTIGLREVLDWWGQSPLFGLRVLVTRPTHQAQPLYDELRRLGAEVLPYATIAIDEAYDRAAWDSLKRIRGQNRWLVFTSENGVHFFMAQWMTEKKDVRLLAEYRIAAVGSGTARALQEFHLPADFVPTKATTAELARQMAESIDLNGVDVVRVRGNLGDNAVEEVLAAAGARVQVMPVYQTYKPVWPQYVRKRLMTEPPDVIFFTSGSSVDGFVGSVSETERDAICRNALVLSIGPMTTRTIEGHGIKVGLEATSHSIPDMVRELVAYVREHPIRRS